MGRRQSPDFQFVRDAARAERARGEGDERVERDEDDVEIVDEEIESARGFDQEKRRRRASRSGWRE
jgi:hypothetical protein